MRTITKVPRRLHHPLPKIFPHLVPHKMVMEQCVGVFYEAQKECKLRDLKVGFSFFRSSYRCLSLAASQPHFARSFPLKDSSFAGSGPSPRTASEPASRRLSLKKEKASTEPLSQNGSTFRILSIAKKWESFDATDDDEDIEETELSASCQTLVLNH